MTEKVGIGTPCFAMGGAVADYDNDGWSDLYVTCHSGNVLYHHNGDGTFTRVTKRAGVADGYWSTGAAFGDYDGDGYVDLMVTDYVDLEALSLLHGMIDLTGEPGRHKETQLRRIPLTESRSRSQRIDLEHIRVIAGRFLGQVDSDAVRVTRPHEIGIRPKQPDSGDLAAPIGGIRSEGLDHQFSVLGPS